MTGVLYIVATPIGNLKDITFRAVEVLKQVDLIAAEDTRHSKKLLGHYGIDTALTSFHEHTKPEKRQQLLAKLQAGASLALISDAGTPLISDPGNRLVYEAKQQGISVVPVPGPCAAITALSAAGLPADRFTFIGFLSAKSMTRRNQLAQLVSSESTLIFYESPHRIVACLQDMLNVFGEQREAVLARELTKAYETIHKATLAELCIWVEQDIQQQKGEFVLLIAPQQQLLPEEMQAALNTFHLLNKELPVAQAVKFAAAIVGVSKNKLYKLVTSAQNLK